MKQGIERLLTDLAARMRSQSIETAGACTEAQFTVFVLDHSGSMFLSDYPPDRYRAAVAATGDFIRSRMHTGSPDLMAAVVFDSDAKTVCTGTRISQADTTLLAKLECIHDGGGTDIEQGIIAAGRILRSAPEQHRKRIVLLSDGCGGTPEKEASKLKVAGVVIDTIGIGGSPRDVDENCLRAVASVVEGRTRYRFIGDTEALSSHFKTIATDLVIAHRA